MTPRVYLRKPSARDREAFLAAVAASRKLHGQWVSPPSDAEAYEAFLRRARKSDFECALVCIKENDALAGVINASQIFTGNFRSAYLGYYAFEPHAGRGYMTEGMKLFLRHAFEKLHLHRLEANIQPGNAASIALVRRCGFRREGFSLRYLRIAGRWRDHERWAILSDEFQMK